MKQRTLKLIVAFLGVSMACGFGYSTVKAFVIERYEDVVENRFIVSPTKFDDLTIEPGKKVTKEVIVVNRLGKKAEFKALVEAIDTNANFVGSDGNNGQGGKPVLSAADWLKPELDKFTLEHGERIKLTLNMDVPDDALTGGYYAQILFAVEGDEVQGKDKIKIINRVGVPVFVKIVGKGEIEESGRLPGFFSDKVFYLMGPVQLTTVFENFGNIHLRPEGEITIRNILGAKIAQIPLRDWLVLPDTKKEQVTKWDKKWLLGKYQADVVLFYGDNEKQMVQKTTTFYAFPLHILLLISVVLVLLYVILKRVLKVEVRDRGESKVDQNINIEK